MKFLCIICSKKESTHIGINGGEHVTLCDDEECWNKFKLSRGGGVKIVPKVNPKPQANKKQSVLIDTKSWFYKNCKRQRKNGAKICQKCPFRKQIEEMERR